MLSQYYAPTKVVFGRGAEDEVSNQLRQFGADSVLLVYGGHSALKSGLLAKVRDNLSAAGIRYMELGGVQPNPRISLARKGIEICRENGIGFILAVDKADVETVRSLLAEIDEPSYVIGEVTASGSVDLKW